ncbi:hypothetical protein [Kushneria konosiri]|uniref:Uncharacterized protein n=1 Tax=Kushneria konosiri TaxID=698828 RepID=A0A2Z2H5C8_9GAMM|nr:hypothetical protein [Kushneria konosiri]ARS52563.1 hypothetical protein B9G99_06455 [Kushneria konosiri]
MSAPFITDNLLMRCRREQRVQQERNRQSFDPAAINDRKELSLLVEQALADGEDYSSIVNRHRDIELTEAELVELIGPEQALRDRIERFGQLH